MMSFEWFVAGRYLRGKRKRLIFSMRSIVSFGGVALGALALVIALSIANGFEKEVRDRIIGVLAHVKIKKYHNEPVMAPDSLRKEILAHPKVLGVSPYIMGKGVIELDRVLEGIVIMGIDQRYDSTVSDLTTKLAFGTVELGNRKSDRDKVFPGIILGRGLADKLGVRPGGEVVVATLTLTEGSVDPVPKYKRFVVSGIFETGMYEYDLNLVYISVESAQVLFSMQGVEGLQIKTTDRFAADRIGIEIKEMLGGYPFRFIDWKWQNKSLFDWMRLERIIIFLVISLIMVVAGFNIISSLIMTVYEKRREIGVLMSMGLTSGAVMRIFMLNGVIIGLMGSTIGVIVGLVVCAVQQRWQLIPLPGDIYFITRLPVLILPFDICAVFIAGNLICWVATLYPAFKASRILPAESIRYE